MFLIRAVLLMVLLCRVPGRKSSISTRKPSLKNITFNVFAYISEANEDFNSKL